MFWNKKLNKTEFTALQENGLAVEKCLKQIDGLQKELDTNTLSIATLSQSLNILLTTVKLLIVRVNVLEESLSLSNLKFKKKDLS